MSVRTRSRVPVIVVSGGLGSGKTTLLNHLLRQGMGRIGVVINDFGDINVDAFLVQGHVDATATISGGCLCCLSDPSELDDTLALLARPSMDLDVIVVEASGLAEPRELARMLLSSTVTRIRFGGIVEVLDAAAWLPGPDGAIDPLPVAVDHLQVASLLVVNKDDLLHDHPEAARRLTEALQRHAPGTPVVRTSYGRIDPTLLFDAAERDAPTGQLSFTDLLLEHGAKDHRHDEHDHHDEAPVGADESCHDHACDHAHHRYSSVSVESPLPVDPRRLVAFLEHRAPGVYRVKGRTHVDVPGNDRQYIVQAVGGWLAFEKRPWPADTAPITQLVAIGTGIDTEAVEEAMRACLSEEGPLDPDRLHAMTRYTR